ncbi:MAG: hypothetical protein KDA61_16735, partial [Planctomycetales bacterium]|nr:hypothetical protein [Planctomycetales bacterium]
MILSLHRFLTLGIALAASISTVHAALLFEEDFESVPLNPIVTISTSYSELADRNAWSDLATAQGNGQLTGWQDEKLGVLGSLDPANSGVREFYGWTFLDKSWWIGTSGDQDRSEWTHG